MCGLHILDTLQEKVASLFENIINLVFLFAIMQNI